MPRTVPSLSLQNPGNFVASALWNSGPKAMGDFYTAPPMFRGRQATFQTTTTAVWAAMNFDAEDVDTDNGHSTSTNNSRYICQVAGWYWVSGYAAWTNAGAQAVIFCAIAVNGTIKLGTGQELQKTNADYGSLCASGMVNLKVNDYVETWGRQDTGGNLNTFVGTDLCPVMNVVWVHS